MPKILRKIIQSLGVCSVLALLACGTVGPGSGGSGVISAGGGGSEGLGRNAAVPTYDGGIPNPITDIAPMTPPRASILENIMIQRDIRAGTENRGIIPIHLSGTLECRFWGPKGYVAPSCCDVGYVIRMIDVPDNKFIQTKIKQLPDGRLGFDLDFNVSQMSLDAQNGEAAFWTFYLRRTSGDVLPRDVEVTCASKDDCTYANLFANDWLGEPYHRDPAFSKFQTQIIDDNNIVF